MKQTLYLLGIGLLLCLPAVWNFLQPQYFHTHDFTHVTRLVELERGFLDGQFPVRWSQNLGYGYGLPQFSFYGPLFYYEALLFRAMTVPHLWAMKLTVVVQVLISFVALFFIGKSLWGTWGGFLTGMAGVYTPYRAVDMYVRGAFGELTGITFIVLSCWAGVAFARAPSVRRAVILAIALAGIPVSHNLMAIVAIPFIGAWILLMLWYFKTLRSRLVPLLGLSGILAFCLSAFYAVPALMEKDLTQADTLTGGFSHYDHHFLYIRQFLHSPFEYGGSISGPEDDISFEVGKVHLGYWFIIGMVSTWFLLRKDSQRFPIVVYGLSILTLLALFIMLYKAKFLWDALPFMAYIQFPWRYLSIVIVLVPILVGATVMVTRRKWMQMGIALIGTALMLGIEGRNFKPLSFLENAESSLYYTDPIRIQEHMSDIIPDFLPKTAKPTMVSSPVTPSSKFMIEPNQEISIEYAKAHTFAVQIPPSQTSTTLTAKIFNFPGWTIYVDDGVVPIHTTEAGLMQATIPARDEVVRVRGRFEDTPIRRVANYLTLAGGMMATLLLLPRKTHA